MTNEKLSVDRCWNANAPDVDDLGCHRFSPHTLVETTEHGPIEWWVCERCPARALHDSETEDGFEPEPVVVYPPSCFEPAACAVCGAKATCRGSYDGSPEAPACDTCCGHGCEDGRCEPLCGCPSKASGETVHHEGCAEFQASVEAGLRALDADVAEDHAQHLRDVIRWAAGAGVMHEGLTGEPLPIVHPPTDPAPPSEELKRAMAEEDGFPWDDEPPTLNRPTPVPAKAGPEGEQGRRHRDQWDPGREEP